jgi:hypothetical protein
MGNLLGHDIDAPLLNRPWLNQVVAESSPAAFLHPRSTGRRAARSDGSPSGYWLHCGSIARFGHAAVQRNFTAP